MGFGHRFARSRVVVDVVLFALFCSAPARTEEEPKYAKARRGSLLLPIAQEKIDAIEKDADALVDAILDGKTKTDELLQRFDKADSFGKREILWQTLDATLDSDRPYGVKRKISTEDRRRLLYFTQALFGRDPKKQTFPTDYYRDTFASSASVSPVPDLSKYMEGLLAMGASGPVWDLWHDAIDRDPVAAAKTVLPWMEERRAFADISGPKNPGLGGLKALQKALQKKGEISYPLADLLVRSGNADAAVLAVRALTIAPKKGATADEAKAHENARLRIAGMLSRDDVRKGILGKDKELGDELEALAISGEGGDDIRRTALKGLVLTSPERLQRLLEKTATEGKDFPFLKLALDTVNFREFYKENPKLSPAFLGALLANEALPDGLLPHIIDTLDAADYLFADKIGDPALPAILARLLKTGRESEVAFALRLLEKHPKLATAAMLRSALAFKPVARAAMILGEPAPGARVYQQLQKTLPATPDATAEVIPELIKAAEGTDHLASVALTVLASHGDTRAIPVLKKTLFQPRPYEEPGHYEFAYKSAAQGLARLVGRDGKVDGPLLKELEAFLHQPGLEYGPAQRFLRKELPTNLRRGLDEAVAKKRIADRRIPTNVCEALCTLFNKMPLWAHDGLFLNPDVYFRKDKPLFTWELATKSLGALFMSNAAKYCAPGKDVMGPILRDWFAERKKAEPKKGDDKILPDETIAELKKAIGEEEVNRILKSMSERATALSDQKRPTPNSIGMFGKGFYAAFLRSLKDKGKDAPAIASATGRSLLDDLIYHPDQEQEDRPKVNLKEEKTFGHDERGSNSHTGLFHYSVGLLNANPDPADKDAQAAVQRLIDIRQEAIRRFGDANALPYNLRFAKDEKRDPRDGAARAVTTHLAIYRFDGRAEEKAKNRDHLKKSLANYVDHFYSIFSGIGDNRTHDMYDGGMAPYYGPASVGYAAGALQLLKRDAKTDAERTEIAALQNGLRLRLLSLLDYRHDTAAAKAMLAGFAGNPFLSAALVADDAQHHGLFPAQGKEVYASSAVYDNPLVGLALVALLDPDQDECPSKNAIPSLGIVQEAVTGGKAAVGPKEKAHEEPKK